MFRDIGGDYRVTCGSVATWAQTIPLLFFQRAGWAHLHAGTIKLSPICTVGITLVRGVLDNGKNVT